MREIDEKVNKIYFTILRGEINGQIRSGDGKFFQDGFLVGDEFPVLV